MLIQEASKWNIISYVLDKDEECPASNVASVFVKGNQLDFDSVYQFGKLVDVLTFEIENININALFKLKSEGLKIVPDPTVLLLIQDKGSQKEFFHKNNIPAPSYAFYNSTEDILSAILSGKINYPFVQKLRKGGYDGRGVAVIEDENDLGKLLGGTSIIEEKIQICKEIAVIAARNENGESRCFPVVEMVVDREACLVEKLICPAAITGRQCAKAVELAIKIIERLEMSGILAIEFFLDKHGELLVNEISPRPHNSGHHTIESIITSQFEQHLRAVFNLSLGSTCQKMPAVMLNLLGEPGYEGPVRFEGLTKSMAIEGVKIHLYGKKMTRPYRKMGHVTVLSSSLECALSKAENVKQLIKVKSWKEKQ